jgi:YqjK-like protein
MSRTSDLEARRRTLLARCEEQRAELAYRVEQLRPSVHPGGWGAGAQGVAGMAANHPLAWLAAAAGIISLFRPKRMLSWMTFATGAVSILSRASTLLKLFSTLRSLRAGFR